LVIEGHGELVSGEIGTGPEEKISGLLGDIRFQWTLHAVFNQYMARLNLDPLTVDLSLLVYTET
jgi:hypothetical protein